MFHQHKVLDLLRRSTAERPAFQYGFAICARRYQPRPELGIVTIGGESLPLTASMLASLEGRSLWLLGRAHVELDAALPDLPLDGVGRRRRERPLTALFVHVISFEATATDTGQAVQLEALARAATLREPLLFLTASRPAGWPG